MKTIPDFIKCLIKSLLDWLKLDETMKYNEVIETWSSLLSVITILVSAVFILITFRKNNRIKASELLLKLEEDYRNHFNILLDIEYAPNMELETLIPKVYRKNILDKKEDKLIEDFEKCLRHLLLSYIIHTKNVDSKLFNHVHKYYLVRICYGSKTYITKYVIDFWPSIYRWFLQLHVNWMTRNLILPFIMDKDLPNFQSNKHLDFIPEIHSINYKTGLRRIERWISEKISKNVHIYKYIEKQLKNRIEVNSKFSKIKL